MTRRAASEHRQKCVRGVCNSRGRKSPRANQRWRRLHGERIRGERLQRCEWRRRIPSWRKPSWRKVRVCPPGEGVHRAPPWGWRRRVTHVRAAKGHEARASTPHKRRRRPAPTASKTGGGGTVHSGRQFSLSLTTQQRVAPLYPSFPKYPVLYCTWVEMLKLSFIHRRKDT